MNKNPLGKKVQIALSRGPILALLTKLDTGNFGAEQMKS